jgi:hypothetical protein
MVLLTLAFIITCFGLTEYYTHANCLPWSNWGLQSNDEPPISLFKDSIGCINN